MSRAPRGERQDSVRDTLKSVANMIPMVSTRELRETLGGVLDTLDDPEVRASLKKTVDLSFDASFQVLQRATKLSRELASGNTNRVSDAVREGVPAMVKAELSMATEWITLNQKYASKMIEIMETSTRKPRRREGPSGVSRDEPTSKGR